MYWSGIVYNYLLVYDYPSYLYDLRIITSDVLLIFHEVSSASSTHKLRLFVREYSSNIHSLSFIRILLHTRVHRLRLQARPAALFMIYRIFSVCSFQGTYQQ